MSFKNQMILVHLELTQWSGQRLDRPIATRAAIEANADNDTVRATRILVPKGMLKAVSLAARKVRATHREHTSPWFSDGTRVLPSGSIHEFQKEIRNARVDFESEAARFAAKYDNYLQFGQAQERLGDLFSHSDFPDQQTVLDAFGMNIVLTPMPSSVDWRIEGIQERTAAELRADLDAKMADLEERTTRYWIDEYAGLLARCLNGMKPKGRLVSTTVAKLARLATRIARGGLPVPKYLIANAPAVVSAVYLAGPTPPNSQERVNASRLLTTVLHELETSQLDNGDQS